MPSSLLVSHLVEVADEQAEVRAVYKAVAVKVGGNVVAGIGNAGIAAKRANQGAEVGGVHAVVVVVISGGQERIYAACVPDRDINSRNVLSQPFRALEGEGVFAARDVGDEVGAVVADGDLPGKQRRRGSRRSELDINRLRGRELRNAVKRDRSVDSCRQRLIDVIRPVAAVLRDRQIVEARRQDSVI